MIDALRLDLRYALRTFWKTPGFSILILLTLALGIGANTAMFSIVDAVLFRPLPAKNPNQLVRIFASDEKGTDTSSVSYPAYTDYRDQSQTMQQIASYSDWEDVHVSVEGKKAERLNGAIVNGNFFSILETQAQLGRVLTPNDDRVKGKHPVVVISDHFWKKYFDSDPAAVGKTIRINGFSFTVVGVTKPEFTGVSLEKIAELWVPMMMIDQIEPQFASDDMLTNRRISWLDMIGRLKPSVSLQQAQAELRIITTSVAEKLKSRSYARRPSVTLISAQNAMISSYHSSSVSHLSWLLMAVTFLVLLIACAVSSGLLLVKAEQRHKEIAVRLAMGASRIQITRQLMLESFLISILAAVAGMVFALWCTDLLGGAVGNEGFTLPLDAATPLLNIRVLLVTAGFACLSALLFGLAPSLLASRLRLIPFLKNETQQAGRHRAFSVKNIFIVAQVAFSILLLVGAGLLLRTLWKTREVNPGFDTIHPVVASIDLAKQGYKRDSAEIFYARLLENLRNTPGIQSAALGRTVPVQESGMRISFEHSDLAADLNIVTPEFFKTLKIPVLRGRDFQGSDTKTSMPVAMVNEDFARKMWPNENPVGKTLSDVGPDSGSVQIIGMVPDIKYRSLRDPAAPTLYLPLAQWYMPGMTIVATSEMDPRSLLPQVQRVVEGLDKNLPVYSLQTLPQKLNVFLLQERVLAGLLTVFGALALLLAAIGLYSLLSFVTQARTKEIGVRMAVGAERKDVLRVFLNRGLALTLTGVALGIVISLSVTNVMKSLLFAVTPFDAWTYFAITLLMTLTAFIASYIPARRAANLDPVVALHYE